MSSALARGLGQFGVTQASVVGLLCRDHHGLVIAMAACGKIGARVSADEYRIRQATIRAGLRAGRGRAKQFFTTVNSPGCWRRCPLTCPESSPGWTRHADLPVCPADDRGRHRGEFF